MKAEDILQTAIARKKVMDEHIKRIDVRLESSDSAVVVRRGLHPDHIEAPAGLGGWPIEYEHDCKILTDGWCVCQAERPF